MEGEGFWRSDHRIFLRLLRLHLRNKIIFTLEEFKILAKLLHATISDTMSMPIRCRGASVLPEAGISNLSQEELVKIFAENGAYFAGGSNFDMSGQGLSNNTLLLCKNAYVDKEHDLLVLPSAIPLGFTSTHQHRSLFIREAYKDHWNIIRQVFEQKLNKFVFINGDCGAGKSMEACYLLYQIFNVLPKAPALTYTDSRRFKNFLLHYRGLIFEGSDYCRFIKSQSHRIIESTEEQLWHMAVESDAGPFLCGPEIVITSPNYERNDLEGYKTYYPCTLYLPLPTLSEMQRIKVAIFMRTRDIKNVISDAEMLGLIDRYGCNPRTVFHYYDRKEFLTSIDEEIESSTGQNLLHTLRGVGWWYGGSFSLIATNGTLHMAPYYKKRDRPVEETNVNRRKAENLEDRYSHFDYKWGSRVTEDRAFQELIQCDRRDIKSIVHIYTHPKTGKYLGLLLEPFAKNLLTVTSVIGRIHHLKSNNFKHHKVKFGPWKRNTYRRYSDIDTTKDVCNIPHWGIQEQVMAIVPWEGLIFGVGKYRNRGINHVEICHLFDANVFEDFTRRRSGKAVRMIWMVESQEYEAFQVQRPQDYNGDDESTSNKFEQWAFEVDLVRISEFRRAQRYNAIMNMAANRWWKTISREFKHQMDDSIGWVFYQF